MAVRKNARTPPAGRPVGRALPTPLPGGRPAGGSLPTPMPADRRRFRQRLLTWYGRHGRDLPWRKTDDPYHILVSEIMLQQTQVDRVLPKYAERLPADPA